MKKLGRIFKGLGGVLIWLLVFGLTALPAVFMNTLYGYLPALVFLFLSLLSLASLLWLRRGLRVETALGDVECVRGGQVDLGLELTNRSLITCPRASAWLYISDLFGGMDSMRKFPFTISGGETIRFDFGMDLSHIGLYSVGLDHLEVYDFFGILRQRIPISGRFTAFVTPRIRPMEEVAVTEEVLAEASTDTRVTVVGGTDYTGVREYALGDPMKQIHWKLSAHSREYMTKLQESSRQQEFAVILDFAARANEDTEQLMELNDCLIETALSLIEEISHHDVGYALLYCDRGRNAARAIPMGREDDRALIQSFSMITTEPGKEYPDGCQLLQQEGRGQNRSTNVIVVTSRVTPELLQELQLVKRQRRSPELYLVVPAAWSSRELEQAAAPLRQLGEQEIPYYLISTAENQAAKPSRQGGGT